MIFLMKMIFSKYPFLRITFFFALGIVGYHYLGESVLISWIGLTALILTYTLLAFKDSFKFQFVLSLLTFCILFGLGSQRLKSFKGEKRPDHLLNTAHSIEAYKAVVVDAPEEKDQTIRLKLEIYSIYDGQGWQQASGFVSVYLAREKAQDLIYGDLLYVSGRPVLTDPPANPGEFNYRGYLIYNRIHHQQFVGEDFQVIGHSTPNWLMAQSITLRSYCTERITNLINDEYARGVALALVLGVKDDLQDDLIRAFSATGAMHVLAVSGLHVGIIYAIVFLLLKALGLSRKKYRWLLAAVSIFILWGYAMLTGLSPSVLRAVTMFTFVALGRAMFRHGSIYNTLAASAMALLLYNPYLIMSVGFQLSYLAVFGIVYLQPKLYALVTVRHKIMDKIWAITCVSIAAQLATAPLSMLYFHQFPTYFLLSNLVVIPAAFVILLGGVALLVFSAVSVISTTLGWLLTKFVVGVNALVIWLSKIPGSKIEGIHLSIIDTWLVYALIVFFILLVVRKRIVYLKLALGVAACFAFSQWAQFRDFSITREFSVLDVSNASVLDLRNGFNTRLYADSAFMANDDKQRFHLLPKRRSSGSAIRLKDDRLALPRVDLAFGYMTVFNGHAITVIDKSIPQHFNPGVPIKTDHLVLSANAVTDLRQVTSRFKFKELILDTSNSWFIDSKLMKQSQELQLNCHSVRQNGYYSKVWRNNL